MPLLVLSLHLLWLACKEESYFFWLSPNQFGVKQVTINPLSDTPIPATANKTAEKTARNSLCGVEPLLRVRS
jgi:hypothetical protein